MMVVRVEGVGPPPRPPCRRLIGGHGARGGGSPTEEVNVSLLEDPQSAAGHPSARNISRQQPRNARRLHTHASYEDRSR